MLFKILLFILPAFSFPALNVNNFENQSNPNPWAIPGEINCLIQTDVPDVNETYCQPVLRLMDDDINHHPDPQTWGPGGIERARKTWRAPGELCHVHFQTYNEKGSAHTFTYAELKSEALRILGFCSKANNMPGKGGTTDLTDNWYLFIDGYKQTTSLPVIENPGLEGIEQ